MPRGPASGYLGSAGKLLGNASGFGIINSDSTSSVVQNPLYEIVSARFGRDARIVSVQPDSMKLGYRVLLEDGRELFVSDLALSEFRFPWRQDWNPWASATQSPWEPWEYQRTSTGIDYENQSPFTQEQLEALQQAAGNLRDQELDEPEPEPAPDPGPRGDRFVTVSEEMDDL